MANNLTLDEARRQFPGWEISGGTWGESYCARAVRPRVHSTAYPRIAIEVLDPQEPAALAALVGLLEKIEATDRWWMLDELAHVFYKETGIMAPFKDMPAAMCGGGPKDEGDYRQEAWDKWLVERRYNKPPLAPPASMDELKARHKEWIFNWHLTDCRHWVVGIVRGTATNFQTTGFLQETEMLKQADLMATALTAALGLGPALAAERGLGK